MFVVAGLGSVRPGHDSGPRERRCIRSVCENPPAGINAAQVFLIGRKQDGADWAAVWCGGGLELHCVLAVDNNTTAAKAVVG